MPPLLWLCQHCERNLVALFVGRATISWILCVVRGRCPVDWSVAVLCGIVAGIVGSIPMWYACESALKGVRVPSIARGLVSVMVSFALLSTSIAVAWALVPDVLVPFGVGEAASFLLLWIVEAWRAWRDAQGAAMHRERTRGESAR